MIDPILCELYKLLLKEKRKERAPNFRRNKHMGYAFENEVANYIFPLVKDYGFKAYPPRFTPSFKTLSGCRYQIDVSFSKGTSFYAIECKQKEFSTNENLYYFNAKLLDYCFADTATSIFGIYLSVSTIEESARIYGLAYGLTVIDPDNPPLAYIRENVPKDSNMFEESIKLQQLLDSNRNSFKTGPSETLASTINDRYKLLLSRSHLHYAKN
jgi:hypothetical protein